ncbi:MAG: tetratricopeptide repeat protein [Planctomycetota bacterium]
MIDSLLHINKTSRRFAFGFAFLLPFACFLCDAQIDPVRLPVLSDTTIARAIRNITSVETPVDLDASLGILLSAARRSVIHQWSADPYPMTTSNTAAKSYAQLIIAHSQADSSVYADAHALLGGLYDRAGRTDEALAAYQTAIKSGAEYARLDMALLLARAGKLGLAAHTVEPLASTADLDPLVLYSKGWMLEQAGYYETALAAYRSAESVWAAHPAPPLTEMVVETAPVRIEKKLDAEANAVAMAIERERYQLLGSLAEATETDAEAALRAFDLDAERRLPEQLAAVRQKRRDALRLFQDAHTRYSETKSPAAINSYNEAIKQFSDFSPAWLFRGIALLENRDPEAAIISLIEARRVDEDNPLVLLHLGKAYLAVNEPLKARTTLRQTVELDPLYGPALDALLIAELRSAQPSEWDDIWSYVDIETRLQMLMGECLAANRVMERVRLLSPVADQLNLRELSPDAQPVWAEDAETLRTAVNARSARLTAHMSQPPPGKQPNE